MLLEHVFQTHGNRDARDEQASAGLAPGIAVPGGAAGRTWGYNAQGRSLECVGRGPSCLAGCPRFCMTDLDVQEEVW